MVVFQTERLALRQATLDDAAFMLALVNEPAWLKFISTHSIHTVEQASEYIEQKMLEMYKNYAYGLWIIENKDNSIPLGICGLLRRESLAQVDLGFALRERYWGNGYASEACIGTLKYAEKEFNIHTVLAIIDPSNTRSEKLLRKLGFHYDSAFSHPGSTQELCLYTNR